jgi:hypothetical protein
LLDCSRHHLEVGGTRLCDSPSPLCPIGSGAGVRNQSQRNIGTPVGLVRASIGVLQKIDSAISAPVGLVSPPICIR